MVHAAVSVGPTVQDDSRVGRRTMVPNSADRGRDNEGQWEWSVESNRIHFSARWVALVGDDEYELGITPDAWFTKVHPDDLDRVKAALDAHLQPGGGDRFDMPHRLRHHDGSYRWMSCRGSVQRNAAGAATRLTGAHADVTADTVMDPETGLPNRLLLLEHLGRSIERANRYQGFHFALLFVDLDRGAPQDRPAAGDPLLVAAARRLETCLRIGDAASSFRHDDVVARLDGDQFAILVDGLKEVGDATVIADRVLSALVTPFPVRGRETFLAPSVGVAVSATGYATPGAVLRDAETALHRAKLLGKTRYEVFDTAILKSARAELQLEADFAGALERGEFKLFYQPVVAVDAHAVVGFEALARWQHPVLGLVSPLDFIPLAEKSGFILPLGLWVLREACRQLKAWQQLPHASADLWVSVNVSAVQCHASLVDDVRQVLADTGLDPRRLVLELTEGTAAERPDAVKALLMQLRSLGIRISVDDFGTGHSSLARLRQFPVDCLKVDRSFVRGVENSADMAGILFSVTTMARQLGLRVVVEGVETEAQLALVRPLQCEVQGYVFSKPLDSDRATALLADGLPPATAEAPSEGPAAAAVGTAAAITAATATGAAARPAINAAKTGPAGPAAPRRAGGSWGTPAYAAAALLLVGALALMLRLGGSSDDLPPAPLSPSAPAGADAPAPASALDPSVAANQTPAATSEAPPVTPEVPSTARNAVAKPQPARADRGARAAPAPAPASAVPSTEAAAATAAVAALEAEAAAAAPPPLPAPAPAEAPSVSSARVVHRHRLGSCRGALSISPQGVVYAPEGEAKDAFRFPYGEFVHGVIGDELTIKTSDRTFRFEPVTVNGKRDKAELTALAASLDARR